MLGYDAIERRIFVNNIEYCGNTNLNPFMANGITYPY